MTEPDFIDHQCEHHTDLPLVSQRTLERAASFFRAAGEPSRLRLLERLSHGELCVSDLAQNTQEGLSTISQRLRVLRAEGLVERRRSGKHIFYHLADDHIRTLVRNALLHAEETAPNDRQSNQSRERRDSVPPPNTR